MFRLALCLLPLVAIGCTRMSQSRRIESTADGSVVVDADSSRVDGATVDAPRGDSATPPADGARDRSVPDARVTLDLLAVDLRADAPRPDLDPPEDAAPGCPDEMVAVDRSVDGGATVFCIDRDQGPALTWVAAEQHCAGLGKRLCLEVEWVAACQAAGGGMTINDMVGNWEWVAEVDGDCGRKRGYTDCDSASCHTITSGSYKTRCCRS
jgi:hypothetical protein